MNPTTASPFHGSQTALALNEFCPRCKALRSRSLLVRANARGARESFAFLLGGEIQRCLTCDSRFIRSNQRMLPSRNLKPTMGGEMPSLAVVWWAISGGVTMCLGIAVWVLHRAHRLPF